MSLQENDRVLTPYGDERVYIFTDADGVAWVVSTDDEHVETFDPDELSKVSKDV